MWRLYLTAKATAQRPSDLVGVADRWAALQLDNAVVMVGTAIENAAQEQVKTGPEDRQRWGRKYTMAQLLDSDFELPLDDGDEASDTELMNIAGDYFDEVG